MAMSYYRKYRPQTLEELIGQEHVKKILTLAAQNNQLSHAYLFCGPKGTGKTSTARILAKMVNCQGKGESGKGEVPCNKCEACLAITDGSHLDFIEIDAASNRGIDDIRSLRDGIKLAPSSAQKKVYVIDEVHMLTTEAFNALLKTLEEPPAHVLFILATTEVKKIPETILSRVQKLDFQLATSEDLVKALEKIVKDEKLEVEDGVLEAVAKRAEGSYRDAQKLLDQLASQHKKISLQEVEKSLNSGSLEDSLALLSALAAKDSAQALKLVHKQQDLGVNLKEFIHDLLENLRGVMLVHYQTSSDPKLVTLSEKLTLEQAIRLINLLHTALEQMKTSSIPSLPLEVAVVEGGQDSVVQQGQYVSESDKTEIPIISEKTIEKLEENKIDENIPVAKTVADSADLGKLLDKWNYILETVKPYNYSLEALLRQVKVLSCDEGVVVLEVPYTFHQRILEAPKSRDLLESVISDVLGRAGRVSCVLGQRPVRVEEVANVELAADDDVIRVAAEIFNS